MHKYESQEGAIQTICKRYKVDAIEKVEILHQIAVDNQCVKQEEKQKALLVVEDKKTQLEQIKASKIFDESKLQKLDEELVQATTYAQNTHKCAQDSTQEVKLAKQITTVAHKEQLRTMVCKKTITPAIASMIETNVKKFQSTSDALNQDNLGAKLKSAAQQAATTEVSATTILRALEGEVACQMGDKLEPEALAQYQQTTKYVVKQQQKGFRSEELFTPHKHKFVLFGRTDGIRDNDNTVVETKNRKNRLLGVPVYEKIQLHVYMFLTKTTTSILLENFNGEQHSHNVHFEKSFWQDEILPNLNSGVDKVYQRLNL